MKSHTVIANQAGQPIITSMTEDLEIKAHQIEPGDWLLQSSGRRHMVKYRRVKEVGRHGAFVVCNCYLQSSVTFGALDTVHVERTR